MTSEFTKVLIVGVEFEVPTKRVGEITRVVQPLATDLMQDTRRKVAKELRKLGFGDIAETVYSW
jgi:hypothetical protein